MRQSPLLALWLIPGKSLCSKASVSPSVKEGAGSRRFLRPLQPSALCFHVLEACMGWCFAGQLLAPNSTREKRLPEVQLQLGPALSSSTLAPPLPQCPARFPRATLCLHPTEHFPERPRDFQVRGPSLHHWSPQQRWRVNPAVHSPFSPRDRALSCSWSPSRPE